MSLAGLKKQFNKANQYLSETVGAAEPTKLDDEYNEMEKKIDVTYELVQDLIAKTGEHLQPNPATRAKMYTVGAISKMQGKQKTLPYPQTEGQLGESMLRHGRMLGEQSHFGRSLVEAGECYKQMADVKYALEDNVKQNFLDPLEQLLNKDMKDVYHHRKKLQGHRLDYDCKKRNKQMDEVFNAEEKLEESKRLAEMSMVSVLENDTEQISQLCALVESQLDFHRQTGDILDGLRSTLKERIQEASQRPHAEHTPKPVLDGTERSRSPAHGTTPTHHPMSASAAAGDTNPFLNNGTSAQSQSHSVDAYRTSASPIPPPASVQPGQPCCKALFDFDPENPGELGFKEGQTIQLISQIDENWYEGQLAGGGPSGFFPVTYVHVITPIPQR